MDITKEITKNIDKLSLTFRSYIYLYTLMSDVHLISNVYIYGYISVNVVMKGKNQSGYIALLVASGIECGGFSHCGCQSCELVNHRPNTIASLFMYKVYINMKKY